MRIEYLNERLRLTDDEDGWSADLAVIGASGEFIKAVLISRQMGVRKLGTPGAPLVSEIARLMREHDTRKRDELAASLPSFNTELDI